MQGKHQQPDSLISSLIFPAMGETTVEWQCHITVRHYSVNASSSQTPPIKRIKRIKPLVAVYQA